MADGSEPSATSTMNKSTLETLQILQEECAEVIQIISKIQRFGFDSCHPREPNVTNLDNLRMETGDIMALVSILIEKGIFTNEGLVAAAKNKMEKLEVWSNIFK